MSRVLLSGAMLLVLAGSAFAQAAKNDNVSRVEQFYAEVVNQGNFDELNDYLTEDFVEHEVFPGLEPNREGVRKFFSMMRGAFPDLNFEIEFTLSDGDFVVAYITMSGTQKGEFMGMAPSGKKFSAKTVDIIRMVDGKAAEHWGVSDAMAMMEQLGAMPPQSKGGK